MANYWLFKTEPETYSFETLKKEKKAPWNGVRNYLARNFLREVKKGDITIIYHSGKDKAAVGLARVIKEAYPEIDDTRKGDWVQLDVAPALELKEPVTLAQMKSHPSLKNMLLIKQSRLSCMPVTAAEFKTIMELAKSWDDFQNLK